VAAVRSVLSGDSIMFITSGGMLVRTPASDISTIGRNTQGVRVVRLKEGDRLIAAAGVAEEDDASSAGSSSAGPSDAPPSPSAV
jgi:DNA gyrase subunit A